MPEIVGRCCRRVLRADSQAELLALNYHLPLHNIPRQSYLMAPGDKARAAGVSASSFLDLKASLASRENEYAKTGSRSKGVGQEAGKVRSSLLFPDRILADIDIFHDCYFRSRRPSSAQRFALRSPSTPPNTERPRHNLGTDEQGNCSPP